MAAGFGRELDHIAIGGLRGPRKAQLDLEAATRQRGEGDVIQGGGRLRRPRPR